MKNKTFLVRLVFFLVLVFSLNQTVSALTFPQSQVLGSETNGFAYPTGSLVNDSGTIYFISGSTKVPFTSGKAFTGLGYSYRNVVKGDLSAYSPSQSYNISNAAAAHPWGQWLSSGSKIYYASQDGLIPASRSIFLSDGGKTKLLVRANKYDFAVLKSQGVLPAMTENDSRLISASAFNFSGGPSSPVSTPNPSINPTQTPGQSPGASNSPNASTTTASYTGTLSLPTLSASSTPSSFVLAGLVNQPIAVYNFQSSGGPVLITELDFNVQTSLGAGAVNLPITSISVGGGVTTTLIQATSSVQYLNILVPSGGAGASVPVYVNYAAINPSNNPSNQTVILNLNGVKYLSGGKTVSLGMGVTSNSMQFIGSYPTFSLSPASNTLTDGLTNLGYISVTAKGGGGINLDKLPITVTTSGNVAATGTPNNLIVTDNGFAVNTQNSPIAFSAGTTTVSTTLTFNSDNFIAPNTTKIYGLALTLMGAVDKIAGYSSLNLSLGGASGVLFDDVGGAVNGVAGSNNVYSLPNYPTSGVIVHN